MKVYQERVKEAEIVYSVINFLGNMHGKCLESQSDRDS